MFTISFDIVMFVSVNTFMYCKHSYTYIMRGGKFDEIPANITCSQLLLKSLSANAFMYCKQPYTYV